jgi:hypothetical protein
VFKKKTKEVKEVVPTGNLLDYIDQYWGHSFISNGLKTHHDGTVILKGSLFSQTYPHVGDTIRFKLNSGRIGDFLIVKVETYGDPDDMYRIEMKPHEYHEIV